MQRIDESGFAFRFELSEDLEKVLQVGRAAAGRKLEVDVLVAARESGRVALVNQEVSESPRELPRELDLRIVIAGGELHRSAAV